jgi:hypothetical protein
MEWQGSLSPDTLVKRLCAVCFGRVAVALLVTAVISGCSHGAFNPFTPSRTILFLCPDIDAAVLQESVRGDMCNAYSAAFERACTDFAGRGRFRNFELRYAGPGSVQEIVYKNFHEQRMALLENLARSEGVNGFVFGFIDTSDTRKSATFRLYAYYRKAGLAFQPLERGVPYDFSLLRDKVFWLGMINVALDQYVEQSP